MHSFFLPRGRVSPVVYLFSSQVPGFNSQQPQYAYAIGAVGIVLLWTSLGIGIVLEDICPVSSVLVVTPALVRRSCVCIANRLQVFCRLREPPDVALRAQLRSVGIDHPGLWYVAVTPFLQSRAYMRVHVCACVGPLLPRFYALRGHTLADRPGLHHLPSYTSRLQP